jgi:hypothetical protein
MLSAVTDILGSYGLFLSEIVLKNYICVPPFLTEADDLEHSMCEAIMSLKREIL